MSMLKLRIRNATKLHEAIHDLLNPDLITRLGTKVNLKG